MTSGPGEKMLLEPARNSGGDSDGAPGRPNLCPIVLESALAQADRA